MTSTSQPDDLHGNDVNGRDKKMRGKDEVMCQLV